MPRITALAHVLTHSVTLYADTPEETRVDYYPGAFHMGAQERFNAAVEGMNAAMTDEEQTAAVRVFADFLCTILAGWNLEDEEGAPLPLTADSLVAQCMGYPLIFPAFLGAVMGAIGEQLTAKNANGTPPSADSASTSAGTAKSTSSPVVSSLNASAPSSSPAGSTARRPSTGSSRTRTGSRR